MDLLKKIIFGHRVKQGQYFLLILTFHFLILRINFGLYWTFQAKFKLMTEFIIYQFVDIWFVIYIN